MTRSPRASSELDKMASAVHQAAGAGRYDAESMARLRYERSIARALWAIFISLTVTGGILAGLAVEARWKLYKAEREVHATVRELGVVPGQ